MAGGERVNDSDGAGEAEQGDAIALCNGGDLTNGGEAVPFDVVQAGRPI